MILKKQVIISKTVCYPIYNPQCYMPESIKRNMGFIVWRHSIYYDFKDGIAYVMPYCLRAGVLRGYGKI